MFLVVFVYGCSFYGLLLLLIGVCVCVVFYVSYVGYIACWRCYLYWCSLWCCCFVCYCLFMVFTDLFWLLVLVLFVIVLLLCFVIGHHCSLSFIVCSIRLAVVFNVICMKGLLSFNRFIVCFLCLLCCLVCLNVVVFVLLSLYRFQVF